MANFQVIDGYGSVITIASSTIGGVQYQQVGASIIGGLTLTGTPSISGAVTLVGNASVSGTVGASVIGLTPVTFSGAPSISGAVTVIGTPSISGSVGIVGNPSISGTVNVAGIPSVSGTVGASVIGNVNTTITSIATAGQVIGSVAVLQGTNPWIGTFSNSSIFAVPVGSVLAVDKVTRNDTLTSIAGADLTTRPLMGDAIGRPVIKPFASEDSTIISYTGSVVSTSVTLIQASVIGQRSYVTDFWVANTGATTTLVTFQDGSTSVIGYTIAPTAGGSNSPGLAIPLKTAVSQDLAFKVGTATSILYLTVKGYQAP